jgi:hypothetical protein
MVTLSAEGESAIVYVAISVVGGLVAASGGYSLGRAFR